MSQSHLQIRSPFWSHMQQPLASADHDGVRPSETPDLGHLVAQGTTAARQGRRAEALRLFDDVLHSNANHLEALLWRGGLSAPDEAIPYLERACSIAPDDERAREGLAWARQQASLADSRRTRRLDIRRLLAGILSLATRRLPLALLLTILLLTLMAGTSVQRTGLGESELALPARPELSDSISTVLVAVPATAQPTASPTVTASPTPTPDTTSALDRAWSADDWPQVITLVEEMLRSSPGNTELTEKLFAAHFNYAIQMTRSDRLAEAIAEFNKALTINVGDIRAVGERQLTELYLQGSNALSAGDFAAAITPLRTLYDRDPQYRSVKTRLYQAYIGHAEALEKAGKKADAYQSYQKASNIETQGAAAQAGLARLKDSAPTQPVTATGKKIEVSIAQQQVTVWENGKVLWRFKASTGKAPYLTRTGNFKILSKMPNAYSSAMQWGMPWWMGIYYAGKWENGFHAMARVGKAQTVLPTSVLGRPATHGCIMLSDKDAKTLYDWAVIGTPVWIH